MNIIKIFGSIPEDCIDLDIKGNDKENIIKNIVHTISTIYNINHKKTNEIINELFSRESLMSTGMQYGIAIPHCTTKRVDELIIFIAISKEGIDFNSTDGSLSKIIVMLLVPEKEKHNHVKTLALIARLLNDKENRNKIINAKSKQVIKEIFSSSKEF